MVGLFWDLIQQSQISKQDSRATSLEERVRRLEVELANTQVTVHELLQRLEQSLGEDLDRDGSIGGA
jgi:predicted RNase H-like nuclease (RuvC/YqgF family)